MSSFVTSMLNPISDAGVESIFTTASSLVVSLQTPTPIMTPSTIATITTSSDAPIPPTIIPSIILENLLTFNSAFRFDERLRSLETTFSEYRQTNPFVDVVSAILENDEFLCNIDENMKKIIKGQVKSQVKEQVSCILPRVEESVNATLEAEVLTRSSHSSRTSYAIAVDLSEMELKNILIEKMEGNKSIQRSDEQRNLYKALVEAYDADKAILDTYGESTILKRRREDDDQEGPSAGSDRGSKDKKKEPRRPPSPDRKWNKTLPAAQGDAQSWISDLARQTDARSSFNELLDTPIDISNFIMNRLNVDTLTPKLLAGPTYELMRGSCTSLTELEYHLEEVYKATTDQLDWVNPEVNRESALDVYSKRRIIAVTELKIMEWHDYKHLDWISCMHTRSKSYPFNSNATIPRRSNRRRVPNIVEPEIRTIKEVVPMADRTMEELLQAPTEGYGEAIVILEILVENFKIKTNLLQLVQANKFQGFERDNPHTHISNFKRMTATLKYRDVPNDAIKLMFFSYSLEGAARIWYEKEPPKSIITWDDLVNKFVNQFFPPSKTTHLKNEISRFTQRFEETFGEAYDRFKEMLRAYQDSLNAAAGGNLLNKTIREALKIIENKSKVCYSRSKSNVSRVNTNSRDNVSKTDDRIDKLVDQISNLVEIVNKQVITLASAKAVEKTCMTCGGAHAYYDCIATDSNQPSVCAATGSYNQEENPRRNLNNDMRSILGSFFQNQASTSGTLPSNIVPNPKGEMKAVTTRSGLDYEGPSTPTNSPLEKVDEQNTEEITEKEHSNCQGSTTHVQPPVVPISILEPNVSRTQSKPKISYPSRLNDQKLREKATNQMEKFFQIFHDLHFDISFVEALLLMPKFASTIKSLLTNKDKLFELAKVSLNKNCSAMLFKKLPEKLGDSNFEADPRVPLILRRSFLRTGRALIDVYGEEITLRVNDESVTFNLNQTMRYSSTYDDNSVYRVDVIDIVCEEFVQDVLDFQYNPRSSNPTLVSNPLVSENNFCKEPIVKTYSPTLTPFGERGYSFLEKLLNEDPFQLPPMDIKHVEETKAKSSIEEPPELELKELPSHLEYAFLEDSNKLPVIMAKDLKDIEKEALIKVLKSHKRAIAWKIFDIKGIDPRFYTHKILMGEDYKPVVQSQRRVNPKIHDVIKKEVKKLLDAGMIYPISDSPWVSPIYFVPKKGGMTVVVNENNELISTRLVTGWRMLERLAGNEFYCFLDDFSREGIVLGHKISKSGIEVDRAKVDVIAKLPHPTTVKGVRSFLGHAGFYRRFIQDFSKIARPMTHLLEKETHFVFSKECVDTFNTLKKKLTEAPVLVVPD
nr:reverse transcriptase domain-containing protein [Tanacetum cinerariifolium]